MEESIIKQFERETDFFRALTDLLPEAYLLVSSNGCLLAGNRSAAHLFSRKSFAGVGLGSLVADPPDKILRALRIWSEMGSMTPISLTLADQSIIRFDGARLSTEAPAAVILIRCVARGESLASREFVRQSMDYLAVQKNIAEKLAVAKQQKESAETTAAMFAHELANPLNAIASTLDILQLEIENSSIASVGTELLHAAMKEIARMADLLNDFRALARPQVFDFRPTDLNKIVEEVMAPEIAAIKTCRIEYRARFDPALPAVMADQNRLKQGILNLCKNGIEAMPNGGGLTITTSHKDGIVALEISDTGAGIPKGFDPFQLFKTTKPAGTGLGLPVAAQIVAIHKGRIEYHSEPGHGARFILYLPVAKSNA
jgi:signal transduction histidine kinase